MEGVTPRTHEDHVAAKGIQFLQHYNLVHRTIPMPRAMKMPAAKAAVDKEWEKLEKISAWQLTKVRNKSDVIDDARSTQVKVHFASLMDLCHLKNAELEKKHQKYQGRIILRGDIVKDHSGSYAVFTEQGSSVSQMKAAKVMDIISRLPGCAGQAADAESAYTQVRMEDAPKLLKIPKSECPDIWIRLPPTTFLDHENLGWPGGWGSPRHVPKQAAADPRGSRTCVCAMTFDAGWHTQGEEGRINVLPWCRLVGVAKNPPVRRNGGRTGLPAWYADGSPHLSLPRTAAVSTAAVGNAPG